MNREKTRLLGMTRDELADAVGEIGGQRYRGDQLFRWMYARGASSFEEMSDLGKAFRERLAGHATLDAVHEVSRQHSRYDGTTKFLFSLQDGLRIESVLIPPATAFAGREASGEDEQRRLTLCVSTQVGCPLDCSFCATATMGFRRNLTAGEILGQILEVRRLTGKTITNVVFMGMGEPMLNYDNVMRAGEILSTGIGIAPRHVTVSTAGWADGIRRMGDERRRMKLAVSLHSAVESTRASLMPVTRRFPLGQLMEALEHYYARVKTRVTLEFIFFDGVNDSPGEVSRLVKFSRRIPSKINVIPFHPIGPAGQPAGAGALRPSPRVDAIVRSLREQNLTVLVRSSAGVDIDAACGQLAVRLEAAGRGAPAPGPPVPPGHRHSPTTTGPL